MRTVFATNLSLKPKGEIQSNLFNEVKARVIGWIENKYKRAWSTSVSLSSATGVITPLENHWITINTQTLSNIGLFEVEWRHPHDTDPFSIWITNCVVAQIDNDVDFTLRLRIAALSTTIKPVGYDLGRPRIVTDLIKKYETYLSGWFVEDEVETINPQDIIPLLETKLASKNRSLPILVVSVDPWNGRPLIDTKSLQNDLLGLAHVVQLKDKWTSFKLTEAVGKDLSCYNGAVRFYWPGFNLDSNPLEHKLFLPNYIRTKETGDFSFGKYLFRFLAGISSFRFTEGHIVTSARKALTDNESKRIELIVEQMKEGHVEKTKLEEELLNAWEKIENLKTENETLREELDREKANWTEFQGYVSNEEEVDVLTSQSDGKKLEFTSTYEAYLKAKTDFSGLLLFLDSANASAVDSPFKNYERVYQLFEAIHTVAKDWRDKKGNLGKTWGEALGILGFDYKDKISPTSQGKYKEEYEFMYKGKKHVFAQHVTVGAKQADKCLSVHMLRDDENFTVVIGHCGRHLSNTTA